MLTALCWYWGVCIVFMFIMNVNVRNPNWGLMIFRLFIVGIYVPYAIIKSVLEIREDIKRDRRNHRR